MQFDPESLPVPDLGLCCFNCHYQLTGLMVHRCPECGRAFSMDEHIPTGDWPTVMVEGEPVYASESVLEILRAAQIPNLQVKHDSMSIYGLSRELSGPARLSVARELYWDAVHLLTRHARGEPLDLPPPGDEADWACKACGESNPGNFEVCWQCNGDRPAAEARSD